MEAITYERQGLIVSTSGLSKRHSPEVRVQVNTPGLLEESEQFLRFVVNYLLREDVEIKPEETLNYGYWIVKFRAASSNLLEVWEYDPQATGFVMGGSLTLHYWHEQHRVCALYGAEFSPPRADKLTVVSAGVMEGLPIQAVRYPWQEHMSGWLLVTEKYDGTIKSLMHYHTYHVTASRPDVAPFIALPVGFRFDLNGEKRAWLDREVACQTQI